MSKRRNFLGNLVAISLTGLWSSIVFSQTKTPVIHSSIIKPKKPRNGARIALIAPAFNTSSEKIDRAVRDLTDMGFQVVPGKYLEDRFGYFSQTDQLRAQDLMDAFKDQTIEAIVCVRGGYGTTRILDLLDYATIAKKSETPYWVQRYNSLTTSHTHKNWVNWISRPRRQCLGKIVLTSHVVEFMEAFRSRVCDGICGSG